MENFTAASISSSVLRGTCRLSVSLIRCLKLSQFVFLLYRLGCFFWFSACVDSLARTEDWLEDMSKHDFATAKSWGIPFVTQKSNCLRRYENACMRHCLTSKHFWSFSWTHHMKHDYKTKGKVVLTLNELSTTCEGVWIRPWGICCGQISTGIGFLWVLWFPLPIIALTAPHSSLSIIICSW
jgi:hypothetical protein